MSPNAHDERKIIELADHVAERMFHRCRGEIARDALRSYARTEALRAVTEWDGRGTFMKYVGQRAKWGVLNGMKREVSLARRLGAAALRGAAIYCVEETSALTAFVDEAANEPPSAQQALTAFFRRAALRYTAELDASGPPSVPDPREDVEANVDRMRLRRAVAALPEPGRSIVERHDYGGETFEEIGAFFGVPRTTVYAHYVTAQDLLRREFEDAA